MSQRSSNATQDTRATLYSSKRDQQRIAETASRLQIAQENVPGLISDLTLTGTRVFYSFLNRNPLKALSLSQTISESLNSALDKVRKNKLKLEPVDQRRLEQGVSYWREQASLASMVRSRRVERQTKASLGSLTKERAPRKALKKLEVSIDEKTQSGDVLGAATTLRSLAQTLVQRGETDQAITNLRKATKLDPNAWFDLGFTLSQVGNYNEALKAYDKFLSSTPNSAYAWNNKGVAYEELQQPQEALECYEKAIAIDGKFAAPWGGKGSVLSKMGRNLEAVAAYQEGLSRQSDNPLILMNLTAIYNDELLQPEKALEYAKRAFAISPKSDNAKANLAELLLLAQQYDESRKMATEIINRRRGTSIRETIDSQKMKELAEQDREASIKLAMHFTIACSYFLEGRLSEGKIAVRDLEDFRNKLRKGFGNLWSYGGILRIIDRSQMPQQYKKELLLLAGNESDSKKNTVSKAQ